LSRAAWVYGLYSSESPEEIRYIGVSITPQRRLRAHRLDVRSEIAFKNNPHKVRWLQQLATSGHTVGIKLIAEYYSEHEAYASEDEIIQSYRAKGHPLTNMAKGGRGGVVVAQDDLQEFYAKRAESIRSEATRSKMSVTKKIEFQDTDRYNRHVGMVRANAVDPEHRKLISDGQKKAELSNDFRGKANTTRRLPENREAARVRAKLAASTPEALERSRNAAKKRWDNVKKKSREELL
jgi:hypothetical protein